MSMPRNGLPEEFAPALTIGAPPPDDLVEPVAIMTDLPAAEGEGPALSEGPMLVEFDEPERLDPARADGLAENPAAERPPPPGRAVARRGLLGSVAVHVLPLLAFVHWDFAAVETVPPIPVQLVVVQPPPTPAPPEPRGRLASEEMGDVSKKPPEPGAGQPEAPPSPQPPKPPERAAPKLVSPLEHRPIKEALVKPPPPKPTPPRPTPPQVATVAPRPTPPKVVTASPGPRLPLQPPHPPVLPARVPGPSATRDEYFAYLVKLTRQHLDVLPLSYVGSRRGQTILTINVAGNGTINRITVAQGSGYPDIDARIEQMVLAVGRFPPLPQYIQEPSVNIELRLVFPEGIEP